MNFESQGARIVATTILILASSGATAANNCSAVLDLGLKNVTSSFGSSAASAYTYKSYCGSDFSENASSESLSAALEVIGYGSGGIDKRISNKNTALKTWCDQQNSASSSTDIKHEQASLVSRDAIEAWKTCLALQVDGIIIEPSVDTDDPVISVRYTGGATSGMLIHPVIEKNFSCKSSVPLPASAKSEAIIIDCLRGPARTESKIVNGVTQDYKIRDRASITLATASGRPFRLNFAADSTPPIPLDIAGQLQDALANQVKKLEQLRSELDSRLKSSQAELDAKLKQSFALHSKMQSGVFVLPVQQNSGFYHVATDPIVFPKAFSAAPQVIATVSSAGDGDRFTVTTTNVTPTGFKVTIHRHMDRPNERGGWGAAPRLHWVALEP